MITLQDFGCKPFSIPLLLQATLGAVATLGVVAGLAGLGSFLKQQKTFHALDIFTGWAIVTVILTMATLASVTLLAPAAILILIMMLAAMLWNLRHGYYISTPFWIMAASLGMVLLVGINMAGIAKWDDFSHWVANALYLTTYDSVPRHGLPAPHSVWPSYPYALPFLTYLASTITGSFLAQGGTMMNFLLLFAFAMQLAEITAKKQENNTSSSLTVLAWALLAVTLANPAFNASFAITNQGDTATMILTGLLGIMLTQCVDNLCTTPKLSRHTLISLTLLACLFVMIKQVAVVLLLLLYFSFVVLAFKNKVLKTAWPVVLTILPVLALNMAWQHFVSVEMGNSGFGMHPMSAWRFDLIPALVHGMMQEIAKKGGLFVLLGGTALASAMLLFRPATPFRNHVIVAGMVGGGYIAFLFIAYLGSSFSEAEIRRAASFYRYTTHVGLLSVVVAWMMIADIIQRSASRPMPRYLAMPIVPVVALLSVLALHSTWLIPKPDKAICVIRETGARAAAALPAGTQAVAVLDPEGNGLSGYIVNLELALYEARTGQTPLVQAGIYEANNDAMQNEVTSLAKKNSLDALLITGTDHTQRTVLGYPTNQGGILLTRDGKDWKRIPF